jgi:hypothetical protein
MVENRRELVKRQSQKKGLAALGAGAATVCLFAFTPWILGVIGLAGTGYLTYDWLRHRGHWGLRF